MVRPSSDSDSYGYLLLYRLWLRETNSVTDAHHHAGQHPSRYRHISCHAFFFDPVFVSARFAPFERVLVHCG
jgi:hypothetical protein